MSLEEQNRELIVLLGFSFLSVQKEKYLPTLKNNYEKEQDEAYREKGLKQLNVNPDRSDKIHIHS